MKYYLWAALLVTMSNLCASEQEVFDSYTLHWNNQSKGYPVLKNGFNKNFDFEKNFTYGEITGTLLHIAAKLNDQNGIRSLFFCPGGIFDRKDILENMVYIEKIVKSCGSLDMMKFLSGPSFFNLSITTEDSRHTNRTIQGYFDREKNECFFEWVSL